MQCLSCNYVQTIPMNIFIQEFSWQAQIIIKEKMKNFTKMFNYIKSSYVPKCYNTFKSYTVDTH